MGTREDINKDKTSFILEITSIRKSKIGNFGQKILKNGTFLSTTLCHGNCHTGTETSYGVLKLEIRVQRMHTRLQRALDGPERSSDGRDMTFCMNVGLMSVFRRKGLNYSNE